MLHVTECYKWLRTWTDSLDKQLMRMKMRRMDFIEMGCCDRDLSDLA
jgi:hypothetical protein